MGLIKEELDSSNRQLGSGWLSGVVGVFLAAIGLAAVLCICYPQLLTVADSREYYNMTVIRLSLHVVLVTAFMLGIVSVVLREQKILGFIALTLVMIASLMGLRLESMN